jgi:hypothetical protein
MRFAEMGLNLQQIDNKASEVLKISKDTFGKHKEQSSCFALPLPAVWVAKFPFKFELG